MLSMNHIKLTIKKFILLALQIQGSSLSNELISSDTSEPF